MLREAETRRLILLNPRYSGRQPKSSGERTSTSDWEGARQVNVLRRVRQQRDLARTLERGCEHSLMSSAGAGLATRLDLAAVGDISAEAAGVFVIDELYFVDAESADTSPPKAATAAPWTPARAFAATTAGPRAAVATLTRLSCFLC